MRPGSRPSPLHGRRRPRPLANQALAATARAVQRQRPGRPTAAGAIWWRRCGQCPCARNRRGDREGRLHGQGADPQVAADRAGAASPARAAAAARRCAAGARTNSAAADGLRHDVGDSGHPRQRSSPSTRNGEAIALASVGPEQEDRAVAGPPARRASSPVRPARARMQGAPSAAMRRQATACWRRRVVVAGDRARGAGSGSHLERARQHQADDPRRSREACTPHRPPPRRGGQRRISARPQGRGP